MTTLLDLVNAAMARHDVADAAAAAATVIAAHMSVQQPDPVEQPREWFRWYRQRTTTFESTVVRLQ